MASSCAYTNAPLSFPRPVDLDLQKPTFPLLRSSSQWQLNYPNHRLSNCFFLWPRKSPSRLPVLCRRESKATVVTSKSWDQMVLSSEIPVLVEFHASWCGPCQMVHRVIDEIAVEYSGKLKCVVIHADTDVVVAENYDIKAVPVVLLFKDGEKRETVIGTMPKEFYTAAIERVLSS